MVKIIILTAPFGEGHRSASDAIGEYLKENYKDYIEVRVVDYFEAFTPKLSCFAARLYQRLIQHWPKGWETFFNITNSFSNAKVLQTFYLIGMAKAKRFLSSFQPDIVISLYPLCGQAASEFKKELDYFSVTVITDFGVHSSWIHPSTDLYFAAADKVKDGLVAHGVSTERIEVSGIPVNHSFQIRLNRDKMRARYGIADSFTILLTSGGLGMDWMADLCRELASMPAQLIVVCGRNKRLFHRIKKLTKIFHNIKPFDFVIPQVMAEIMTISDLMIGKAGGLTVSEALLKGLPMLLYKPTPGQETYNVNFLIKNNVALLAKDKKDIAEKAALLMKQPSILNQLRVNISQLDRPLASEKICKKLFQRWLESKSAINLMMKLH